MRISELADASAVPLATIKFYLREGLLFPGVPTGPNQAAYGQEHVRRLRLIRAMLQVGGMSVAQAREVVTAIDSPDLSVHQVLGTMQANLAGPAGPEGADVAAGAADIDRVVADRGWRLYPGMPERATAAAIWSAWRTMTGGGPPDLLDTYARAAELVADVDLRGVGAAPGRDGKVDTAVVGTVFGDALLLALRRLAQVHASRQRFEPPETAAGVPEQPVTDQPLLEKT